MRKGSRQSKITKLWLQHEKRALWTDIRIEWEKNAHPVN